MSAAEQLLDLLKSRGLTLAVAEGDTGGLLLEMLTAIPGSSAVVLGGVATGVLVAMSTAATCAPLYAAT